MTSNFWERWCYRRVRLLPTFDCEDKSEQHQQPHNLQLVEHHWRLIFFSTLTFVILINFALVWIVLVNPLSNLLQSLNTFHECLFKTYRGRPGTSFCPVGVGTDYLTKDWGVSVKAERYLQLHVSYVCCGHCLCVTLTLSVLTARSYWWTHICGSVKKLLMCLWNELTES